MKRAVSVSIGSSKRDKAVEVNLLGEQVRIERIGTDGDMEKAALLFKELDGKVDAFGLGGGLPGPYHELPLAALTARRAAGPSIWIVARGRERSHLRGPWSGQRRRPGP